MVTIAYLFLFIFILLRIRQSGLFPFRINLKQIVLQRAGRTPWTGDPPVARPQPAQDNINTEKNADIYPCLVSIRTHDSSVQQGENISCLDPAATVIVIGILIVTKVTIVRRGADKSLAFPISCFPICGTTKRIFLGWVKEVITTKS
jgi:hypothetical protein